MKNKRIALCAFLTCSMIINAQKKYEKIFYNVEPKEASEMGVAVKDAVSMKEYTKFNLKISNKGNDILIYKPEESTLKANNKDIKPVEKKLIIFPTETDNRVVNVNGTDFMIPSYSFVLNGVYKVSVSNSPVTAADFQLPPSQNDFTAGNFSCSMSDLSKETDKTSVKFECRYTGDKIGVINPARAAIKLPDGTEIANAKSKQSPEILMKGESTKITLTWNRMAGGKATDMQKINLMILWRNTFVESDSQKLDPITLDFKLDETKSK